MPTDLKELAAHPTPVEPRILLVDDDPALLQLMTRWLSGHGCTVLIARTGVEALTLLEREGGCEVAVSDHRMPGMTGTMLLDAIKVRWPACRRVLFTGHADGDLVLEAMQHKVLTKQMDPYLVRDAIVRLARGPR